MSAPSVPIVFPTFAPAVAVTIIFALLFGGFIWRFATTRYWVYLYFVAFALFRTVAFGIRAAWAKDLYNIPIIIAAQVTIAIGTFWIFLGAYQTMMSWSLCLRGNAPIGVEYRIIRLLRILIPVFAVLISVGSSEISSAQTIQDYNSANSLREAGSVGFCAIDVVFILLVLFYYATYHQHAKGQHVAVLIAFALLCMIEFIYNTYKIYANTAGTEVTYFTLTTLPELISCILAIAYNLRNLRDPETALKNPDAYNNDYKGQTNNV